MRYSSQVSQQYLTRRNYFMICQHDDWACIKTSNNEWDDTVNNINNCDRNYPVVVSHWNCTDPVSSVSANFSSTVDLASNSAVYLYNLSSVFWVGIGIMLFFQAILLVTFMYRKL